MTVELDGSRFTKMKKIGGSISFLFGLFKRMRQRPLKIDSRTWVVKGGF